MEQDAPLDEGPPAPWPDFQARGLEHSLAPPKVKPKGAPPGSLDKAMWRQARAMADEARALLDAGPPQGPSTPKTAPTRPSPTTPQRPPSRRTSTHSAGSHDKMDAILNILK